MKEPPSVRVVPRKKHNGQPINPLFSIPTAPSIPPLSIQVRLLPVPSVLLLPLSKPLLLLLFVLWLNFVKAPPSPHNALLAPMFWALLALVAYNAHRTRLARNHLRRKHLVTYNAHRMRLARNHLRRTHLVTYNAPNPTPRLILHPDWFLFRIILTSILTTRTTRTTHQHVECLPFVPDSHVKDNAVAKSCRFP